MDVFCLRVAKNVAGTRFPFDRVYLVRYADRTLIEQLFRYALVLPLEGVLRNQLDAVIRHTDTYTNRTFHRNDPENTPRRLDHTAWYQLLSEDNWLVVVPILPKWMKQNVPAYLVAERWYRRIHLPRKMGGRTVQRETPFTTRSYLQIPNQKIRPICVACPRMILHQNGECQIGDAVCFDSLPLGMADPFEHMAALSSSVPNVLEPEEYRLQHDEELIEGPPGSLKVLNE